MCKRCKDIKFYKVERTFFGNISYILYTKSTIKANIGEDIKGRIINAIKIAIFILKLKKDSNTKIEMAKIIIVMT